MHISTKIIPPSFIARGEGDSQGNAVKTAAVQQLLQQTKSTTLTAWVFHHRTSMSRGGTVQVGQIIAHIVLFVCKFRKNKKLEICKE